MQKPRLLYGEDYASLAFNRMRAAYNQVKDNLTSARDAREVYFNQKTKDRQFAVGGQVLVKFPQAAAWSKPKVLQEMERGFQGC